MSVIEEIANEIDPRLLAWRCSTADIVRDVLAAIEARGLVVVPKVATEEMDAATDDMDVYWGYYADGRPSSAKDAYRLMISAAPKVE